MSMFGTPVTVSPALPMPPSFNESIRRRVRHGLADVLSWLGEDVGPKPDEATHAFNTPQGLIVSQEVYDRLRSTFAALSRPAERVGQATTEEDDR